MGLWPTTTSQGVLSLSVLSDESSSFSKNLNCSLPGEKSCSVLYPTTLTGPSSRDHQGEAEKVEPLLLVTEDKELEEEGFNSSSPGEAIRAKNGTPHSPPESSLALP